MKVIRCSLSYYNDFLQSDENFVSEILLFNRGWTIRF